MDKSGQVNSDNGDNLPPAVQAIPSASPVKGNGDLPEVAMPSQLPNGAPAPIIPNAPASAPAPGMPAPGPMPMPPMPPMPPAGGPAPIPDPDQERAPIQMPAAPATPAPILAAGFIDFIAPPITPAIPKDFLFNLNLAIFLYQL